MAEYYIRRAYVEPHSSIGSDVVRKRKDSAIFQAHVALYEAACGQGLLDTRQAWRGLSVLRGFDGTHLVETKIGNQLVTIGRV